jgi:hypothetical protein
MVENSAPPIMHILKGGFIHEKNSKKCGKSMLWQLLDVNQQSIKLGQSHESTCKL